MLYNKDYLFYIKAQRRISKALQPESQILGSSSVALAHSSIILALYTSITVASTSYVITSCIGNKIVFQLTSGLFSLKVCATVVLGNFFQTIKMSQSSSLWNVFLSFLFSGEILIFVIVALFAETFAVGSRIMSFQKYDSRHGRQLKFPNMELTTFFSLAIRRKILTDDLWEKFSCCKILELLVPYLSPTWPSSFFKFGTFNFSLLGYLLILALLAMKLYKTGKWAASFAT